MYHAGFSSMLRRSTAGVIVPYQPIPISGRDHLVLGRPEAAELGQRLSLGEGGRDGRGPRRFGSTRARPRSEQVGGRRGVSEVGQDLALVLVGTEADVAGGERRRSSSVNLGGSGGGRREGRRRRPARDRDPGRRPCRGVPTSVAQRRIDVGHGDRAVDRRARSPPLVTTPAGSPARGCDSIEHRRGPDGGPRAGVPTRTAGWAVRRARPGSACRPRRSRASSAGGASERSSRGPASMGAGGGRRGP